MWSNALWRSSHEHGQGSHLAVLTVFWPKMECLDQKLNILVKNIKNSYQKLLMATMVAMAAARRVKTALMLENIFEILTPLGHENIFLLLFYWYNKTISKLF